MSWDEKRDRLTELWSDPYKTGTDIAAELGVSERALYCYAQRHRDVCPKRKAGVGPRDERRVAFVKKAKERGVRTSDLARALNLHVSTICRYVRA
jgi:transposase-like protein